MTTRLQQLVRAPAWRIGACLALAAAAAAPDASAQGARRAASPISAHEIDGHLRFLSHDLLEGRAPGTRGGRLTAEYIAAQLRAAGVAPGVGDTSYFQRVPIDIVKTVQSSVKVTASGKATATLDHPNDVVVWAGSAQPQSAARGELVFVGYGARAPEYRWDDVKGMDLKGKVLLVLVNDPPAPASEPDLFGGRAMTYYGRWTYKFEEAERQGAAGMLIVHTTERAGYGWNVVVGSNSTEHRLLPRTANETAPIGIRGWIKDTVAAKLLAQAGLDFDRLRAAAATRDFRPVATGITIDASLTNEVAHLQSENVIGVLRGSDPRLRDQYVAYTSHWDHLGVGVPVNGDSIYNGAYDNASGVSTLLAVARAAREASAPKRSLLFVFVTAEESGLLGSAWFGQHPTVPVQSIVANLNVDEASVAGRTKDLEVLGLGKSSLGPSLQRFLAPIGMSAHAEREPEKGLFYRSDHFSLARVGVPAMSIGQGTEYVGKPKGWGERWNEEYTANRYHQPSDEYRADFDLSGSVMLGEILLDFGRALANAPTAPTWNRDAEFRTLRPAANE